MLFVFMVSKNNNDERKEERKTEFIYAFEKFVSRDKECFTLKLSLIGCCYVTKTGLKNVQLSITELKLDLRIFCKGWSIYKMALTIQKPKRGEVSDFGRFKESRFTQVLYWQRLFVDFCFILCMSTAVLLTVRPTWSLGTVKKSIAIRMIL